MDVNIAEHSTVITFSDYHEGSAPALIMNHTPWDILSYKQRYGKGCLENLISYGFTGPSGKYLELNGFIFWKDNMEHMLVQYYDP